MTRSGNASLRALFVMAAVIAAVLLLASTVQATGGVAEPDPTSMTEYTVRHGDNLWSIAEAHTAAGGDTRAMVDTIRTLNYLQESTIHSGQTLVVPTS